MKLLRTVWKQSKWALITVAVLLAVGLLVIRAGSMRTDLLLSGLGINAELNVEGTAWLQEDLALALQAGEGEKTAYVETTMASFADDSAINENYYLLENILKLCSSDSLDYFIMDKTAMENLISQNIFMDLGQFFTDQERENLEAEMVYAVAAPENGEKVDISTRRPVALKLSEIPFFAENSTEIELYFAISSQSTRLTECRTLWDHIMNWKNQTS